jgi:hypothetical protein
MSETIRLSCDCQIRQGEGFVHLCPAHQGLIDDEREACAKIAEAPAWSAPTANGEWALREVAKIVATEIRARNKF